MKKLFFLINTIILLYTSLYSMEQLTTEKSLIHKKAYTLETQPRTLMSRFNLVKTYQKYNNPKFNNQELQTLKFIIIKKIEDELLAFQVYQSPKAKEFLEIINKKDFFTKKQKNLFEKLLHQEEHKASKTINNSHNIKNIVCVLTISILFFTILYHNL